MKAGRSPIAALTRAISARVERTRLLYLYPSGLTDELIEAVLGTGVPYFDLSLQHVSRPLLARMRRWGDGERFLRRIADIRAADARATFRSSFILGYPGETERDHDRLLGVPGRGPAGLGRLLPLLQRGRHPRRRPARPGAGRAGPGAAARVRRAAGRDHGGAPGPLGRASGARCWSTRPGRGRTVHEAPEIDGIVHLPDDTVAGELIDVVVTAAVGPDLYAVRADRMSDTGRPPRRPRSGRPRWPRPANAVTIARLLAAPVFVVMIVVWGATWFNFAVGFIVAASDGLDGYIARRQGTTRSGAFLDPLADKALVLGALVTLASRRAPALVARGPHRHPRGRDAALPLVGRRAAACRSRPATRPSSRRSCRTWPSAPAWRRRWSTTTGCRSR